MAINYVEKGAGLHKFITDNGYTMRRIDGVWYTSDDAEVQKLIDSYDPLSDAQQTEISDLDDYAEATMAKFMGNADRRRIIGSKLSDARSLIRGDKNKVKSIGGDYGKILNKIAKRTSKTELQVARDIVAEYESIEEIESEIEAIVSVAASAILAETDWTKVGDIRRAAITEIDSYVKVMRKLSK